MKKFCIAACVGWMALLFVCIYGDSEARNAYKESEPVDEPTVITQSSYILEPVTFTPIYPEPVEKEEEVFETILTEEEIDMIARLTYAEAGNQEEEGIRLVIDTILNRVDHPRFPSTVWDVIYQPRQFSPMWNGSYNVAPIRDDIRKLVVEEAKERSNHDVIFFNAIGYSYGRSLFKVGDHYFSSYE